ncbi:MAG TPA: hypothetical protein PKC18_13840 [Lacipirellulaceae bacterium]|nr:hypothetical protein [Lacipirellulaceae bacterium]HMP07706.1 hypothetical protein [Lacipirellulaceae bacterium]
MLQWLSDRGNWELAAMGAFAWMIAVPLAVTIYYRRAVARLEGGSRLDSLQQQYGPMSGRAAGNMASAIQIWRELKSGAAGPEAFLLVKRCMWLMGLWVVGLVLLFGPLLYVDAQQQAQGGWPDTDSASQSD